MFSSYITLIILQNFVHCLVPFSSTDKHLSNEEIVKNTIVSLFDILKLKEISYEWRINETLNKHFLQNSQDFNKTNEFNINTVDDTESNTIVYPEFINKLLNEINDSKYDEHRNVTLLLEYFINGFKKLNKYNDHSDAYVNINRNVLEQLRNLNPLNSTNKLNASVKSDAKTESNEFWEPSGRRIFRGERTKIKHFPFMASIHIFNSFYCAGSILSSDIIITACSCLQLAWNNRFFRENPSFLSIRIGSSFYEGGGEIIPVLEVYFYPGYTPTNLKHNVCLLRLVRHIKFRRRDRKVKKILFDTNPSSSVSVNTPGITIVGWGAKEHSGMIKDPWSNKLSHSLLHFYPLKDCQDIYSKEYVSRNNFCAGFISRGGGACNRDVGGPGISSRILMGIISFGPTICGSPDAPTVFTKVGYYSKWIEEIMKQKVPVGHQRTTLKTTFNPYTPSSYGLIRPTTFVIPPISGKVEPKSIFQITEYNIGNLRNDKKDLLKDFLLPLFSSKELGEYKDIYKIFNDTLRESIHIIENQNETGFIEPEGEGYTNINETDLDTGEVTEPSAVKFTVLDYDVTPDASDDITNAQTTITDSESLIKDTEEISKLLNDKNLEDIINEELNKQYSTGTHSDSASSKDSDELIYLTNFENNQESEEENADKGFKDLTRQGKLGITISEDEIFKVLYDVINEEIKNKKD